MSVATSELKTLVINLLSGSKADSLAETALENAGRAEFTAVTDVFEFVSRVFNAGGFIAFFDGL